MLFFSIAFKMSSSSLFNNKKEYWNGRWCSLSSSIFLFFFLLMMFLKHFPGQFISFSQQQRSIYRCVCSFYLDKPNKKGFVSKSSFFFFVAAFCCLSVSPFIAHSFYFFHFIHVARVLFGMLASCAKCDSFLLSQSVRWTLIYSDLPTFFFFYLDQSLKTP